MLTHLKKAFAATPRLVFDQTTGHHGQIGSRIKLTSTLVEEILENKNRVKIDI